MPKEVKIPFQPEFKELMLSDKKRATTRPNRYGHLGDWFRAFGEVFVLIDVYHIPLNRVAFNYYPEEGFNSSQEFKDCWNKLHPHVTFEQRPQRLVYFHLFRLKSKLTGVVAVKK